MSDLILCILALVVGTALGLVAFWVRARMKAGGLKAQATQIIQDAQVEKERILRAAEVEAKDALLKMQQTHEREVKKQRDELGGIEKRLRQRETNVERKNELLERRERELKRRENAIENGVQRAKRLEDEAQGKVDEAERELARVASLSQEDARAELRESLEEEAHREAAAEIKRIADEARAASEENAKKIISSAILRLAGEFVAEKTVSVVELPSDDMKGRIIGREGRNIRAIEAATGVDVIIDDTPEVVILSAFNPVRREVAKMALERLVSDGRIHPARIEEVVEKANDEMEQILIRAGEQATFDLGLHGLHPELVRLLGRLKYRSVNGQNLWNHSLETANIAGMLAAELGVNVNIAKRAGLLHDIGKAVDHEVDGDHAQVGAEHARRFGEKVGVVSAIRSHHSPDPPSVLGVLVQAADSISRTRPGARRDWLETYIKRLEDLERIGLSFKGVEKAFAVQAGREVRVMVDYAQVSDDQAYALSRDIARRIENELTYPGEVRVTVLRESRATDVAR